MRWAQRHPDWVLAFGDELWWSRLAQPTLHAWTEADQVLRLIEPSVARDDSDPKALAGSGLLRTHPGRLWQRFVDGRPVRAITPQLLGWCCERLEAEGTTALLLIGTMPPGRSATRSDAGDASATGR